MTALAKIDPVVSNPWPGLQPAGWIAPFALPDMGASLLSFFDKGRLPFDEYAPNAQRYRRFSQYRAFFASAGKLMLERLPHRPFVQPRKANQLSGGILRNFAPLETECDALLIPYVDQAFDRLRAPRLDDYQLDMHFYRVYGRPDIPGQSVPEGRHFDGMECVYINVLRRHLITPGSAEFSMHDPVTGELWPGTKPFVVQAGYGILLDDQRMKHDAKPVVAAGAEEGLRDYVVMNINRWGNRRYGRAHERRSMAEGAEFQDAFKAMKEPLPSRINRVFERALHNIEHGSPYALLLIDSIKGSIPILGGYGGLNFTEQDLMKAEKAALVIGANAQFERARMRFRYGQPSPRPLHTVRKRVNRIRRLNENNRHPSMTRDGLRFTALDRERLEGPFSREILLAATL